MTSRLPRDLGLLVRTAVGGLLVVAAGLAFTSLTAWLLAMFVSYVVGVLQLSPTGVASAVVTLLGDPANWRSPLVVPLTAVVLGAQYRWVTRRPVRASVAAHEPTDEQLSERLRRLARQAGVPAPDLVVADARTANSYAVGRRGNATVVVTDRLVDRLTADELDAVLSHELAHVRNRDATVLTVALAPYRLAGWATRTLDRFLYWSAVVLVWGATLGAFLLSAGIVLSAAYHLLFGWLPGVAPLSALEGPNTLGHAIVEGPLLLALVYLLLAAIFAVLPLVALGAYRLLLDPVPRMLTRSREFAADRGAAAITGDPAALASALETLDGPERPSRDARRVHPLAALCLRPSGVGDPPEPGPLRRRLAERMPLADAALSRLAGPLVAHPDTDERVARLRRLVDRA